MTYDKLVSTSSISVTTKAHELFYWQIEANSFAHDKLFYNKKFNVILSTTTLDISIPQMLFTIVNRAMKAKQTKAGFIFDCEKRNLAKDIVLKFNGQDITIPGNVYADQIRNNCYLRLKPSENNDWVLGLQFYYAYATCFDGNKKIVQFNKNLYGEFQ